MIIKLYSDFSYNKITEVPVELGELSNLEILNLNDNLITEIPFEIKNGKLNKLRNFNIRNNNISNMDELCIYAGTELETNTESEAPIFYNAIYNNVRPLNKNLNTKSKHTKRDSLGHMMYAEIAESENGTSDITSISNETPSEIVNEKLKSCRERIAAATENYTSLDEQVQKDIEIFLNDILKDTDLLSPKNKEIVDDLIKNFYNDVLPKINTIIDCNTKIKEELKK
eukprot:jgi/Orpsp1_1/1192601/evm.model.d7180000094544.1